MIGNKNIVKNILAISQTDYSKDDIIEQILEQVSKYIANYCNDIIELTSKTFYFSGLGQYEKFILHRNVNSITGLYYRSTREDDWEEISAENYTLEQDADGVYYVYYPSGFVSGSYNYKLVISLGYAAADMPADIEQAAAEATAIIYKETAHDKNTIGYSEVSESFNGRVSGSTKMQTAFQRIQNLLKPYIRYTI